MASNSHYSDLVWFRDDLRTDDHPALSMACQQGQVSAVFVVTLKQWQQHHEANVRLGLKADALAHLQTRLADLGIPLSVLYCDWFSDIPALLAKHCQQHNIERVWLNAEHPWNEQQRDKAVTSTLQQAGIACTVCAPDRIVLDTLWTQQGAPFRMFTPFYRRWRTHLSQLPVSPLPAPSPQGRPLLPTPIDFTWAPQYRKDLWWKTEEQLQLWLHQFCQNKLLEYQEHRDYPAISGTSLMSPYLSLGMISPRRCVQAIQARYSQIEASWLADTWLKELAWRDFYRQLLLHFPNISKGKAFKPDTEQIVWRTTLRDLEAWQTGYTGFPIIDAAMRQLLRTGWMHNRLRMLSATFLSKLLLIDWRLGEAHFMEHLIDGDFAANNGGWQWCASTGCDSAPYFRVFNPTRQSSTFDPQGHFIRRFVPELASLNEKDIHFPTSEQREQCGYPEPIVDYQMARQRVMAAFQALSA